MPGGIIQFGYLKAWIELGYDYDVVFGSSVGSLNGALLHGGDLEKLEWLWKNIKSSDVYSWFPWYLTRPMTKKASIYDNTPLLKTIKKSLNYQKIKNNPRDFFINATDYFNWKQVSHECKTLSEEELTTFLWASAAPPIFFEPVKFRDKVLVDSGLTNNYNIKDALREDVEIIVLMVPSARGARPEIKNILDVVSDTISIPMYTQLNEGLGCAEKINDVIGDINAEAKYKYKDIKLIKILAQEDLGIGFLDFDYKGFDRNRLIEHGYNHARKILEKEEIKCLLTREGTKGLP